MLPPNNLSPTNRVTGIDSPVIKLSSTEAEPSNKTPSSGMISPAKTSNTSPSAVSEVGTSIFSLSLSTIRDEGSLFLRFFDD